MKAVLALVGLCGLLVTVESACDSSACTPSSTAQTCSNVKKYVECLQKEAKDCTDAQDTIKTALDTTIKTASEALKKCSGTMVTVSVTTMILSLLAFYLKP